MATPMRSTDFRSVVEPILNEVFDGVYEQRADEWKMVFREQKGIPRNYHEEPVLYGFGAAPELPDGMAVSYQSGGVLFLQRYLYKVYGLAFSLTKVLLKMVTTFVSVRPMPSTWLSRSSKRKKRCRQTCLTALSTLHTAAVTVLLLSARLTQSLTARSATS
jgi:hypothetical protein